MSKTERDFAFCCWKCGGRKQSQVKANQTDCFRALKTTAVKQVKGSSFEYRDSCLLERSRSQLANTFSQRLKDFIKNDLWIVILDILAVNLSYLLALYIRFFVNGEFRVSAA